MPSEHKTRSPQSPERKAPSPELPAKSPAKPEMPGHTPAKPEKGKLDEKLDKALKESFPASDPQAVGQSSRKASPGKPVDRKPPRINKALVDHLAKKVSEHGDTE